MEAQNPVDQVFSFYHACNSVVSTEHVQVSRNVAFRKVDAYGFGSIISANGRQEKITSP